MVGTSQSQPPTTISALGTSADIPSVKSAAIGSTNWRPGRRYDDRVSRHCESPETQSKLAALLTSPLPRYFGQRGYSQRGRVRPGTPTLSETICATGATPLSTQFSNAVSESHEALNTELMACP